MKRFVVWLCGALLIIAGVFTSCDKSEEFVQTSQSELTETETSQLRSTSMFYGMEIVGVKPYADALHGRPNETQYKFYVANPPTDLLGVIVQFSPPAGGTVNKFMSKNSAGNFFLQQTLMQSGRYEVEYILRYRSPKTDQTVIPNSGFIDNTLVNFDGEVKKLVWPFGADGSSWNNWGDWRITCGHGCNKHTKENNDYYALDWQNARKREGNEIRSPLDGKVIRNLFNEKAGYLVTISQTIGDKTYVFHVGHMQKASPLRLGSYVQAGKTVVGYVGQTGNVTGPHAHMSLRENSIHGTSTQYDFSAQ